MEIYLKLKELETYINTIQDCESNMGTIIDDLRSVNISEAWEGQAADNFIDSYNRAINTLDEDLDKNLKDIEISLTITKDVWLEKERELANKTDFYKGN